ncbi:hypothetical protein HRE53_04235 [Acaryochloris sp. 'Moss Beach']|uniref:hypothetical protein n=1 Tax=Acaryochloris sp. 'Moss Beach' TaxID=2740837 RepID=UPI001F36CEDF|nr:hypothetical protein [Acaryochloris sp. 'Moss Beach']UJB70333.1 hypothetical protein HRE53_04235 [Acaryochloris sp. 'Moss Beach']
MEISEDAVVYGKSGVPYTVVEIQGSHLLLADLHNSLKRVSKNVIHYWHPPIGSLVWSHSGKESFFMGAFQEKSQLLLFNGKSTEVETSQICHWQMLKTTDLKVGDRVGAIVPQFPNHSQGNWSYKDLKFDWAIVKLLSLKQPLEPDLGASYAHIYGCGMYQVKILSQLRATNIINLNTHDKEIAA